MIGKSAATTEWKGQKTFTGIKKKKNFEHWNYKKLSFHFRKIKVTATTE